MSLRGCARSATTILTMICMGGGLIGCAGEYSWFGQAAAMPKAERFHGFPDPAMTDAQRQADELSQAIAKGASPAATAGPPIRWIDVRHETARSQDTPVAMVKPSLGLEPIYVTPPGSVPAAPVTEVKALAPAPVNPGAQAAMNDPMVELLRRIRGSDDPAMVKALRAAALGVISGQRTLAPEALAGLNAEQGEHVRQYHQLLLTLSDQIVAGGGKADTDAIVAKLDALFGRQPVRIARAELCTRVDNFGVYEPFGSTTFLAGREQPMILYLEIESFHCEEAEGIHEVRLEQDVVLYSEADGLAVWRVPAETIIDRSRNRRRDFFTVKMLHLPSRLGVGKFQLKVRIKDLGGLTVDETAIPVQFVADQNLASLK